MLSDETSDAGMGYWAEPQAAFWGHTPGNINPAPTQSAFPTPGKKRVAHPMSHVLQRPSLSPGCKLRQCQGMSSPITLGSFKSSAFISSLLSVYRDRLKV